ncbi:MerR family transcriptional regulator [bacterium]|nr:MerR family transcriptional regulator [bacterium]
MDEIKLDDSIPKRMFYKIGDVSQILGVKPYVLRYWESEFKQIRPAKNRFGQRVYRQKDLVVLLRVKELLYKEKFTIAGAKKQLSAERLIRQPAAEGSNGKGKEHIATDLDKYISLLREQKNQIQEILRIFKSETDIKSKTEVGA